MCPLMSPCGGGRKVLCSTCSKDLWAADMLPELLEVSWMDTCLGIKFGTHSCWIHLVGSSCNHWYWVSHTKLNPSVLCCAAWVYEGAAAKHGVAGSLKAVYEHAREVPASDMTAQGAGPGEEGDGGGEGRAGAIAGAEDAVKHR